jgi:hypothetical protein
VQVGLGLPTRIGLGRLGEQAGGELVSRAGTDTDTSISGAV